MITKSDIISIISKSALVGTAIVFSTNIICLFVGYLITKDRAEVQDIGLITIVLAIVGIADLIFGFVLKAKMLDPLFGSVNPADSETLWQTSLRTTIIISAICAALPIYGLVSVIIEGNMNSMVAFAIASLAGFMLLRLRPRNFQQLKVDDYNSDI